MSHAGELDRRLANVVRIGTVAELDEAKALVKIDLGDVKTDWLPWATARAGGDRSWSAPEVGEQVMLFAPSGELADAVVMGSVNQTAHGAPASSKDHTRYQWADGAYVDYDRAAHKHYVSIPNGGSATVQVGPVKLIVSGSGVRVIGNLVVEGNMTAGSGASGSFTTPQGNVVTVQDGIITNIF